MLYILYGLFFLSCVILIISVLLQPGKTDAGALFTSNVSSAALAPRGTASVLSKATIASAIIFMVTALLISMPALSGNVSVLQNASSDSSAPAPTTEVPAAAPTDANTLPANSAVNASNGALIETPATESFSEQANANTAANAKPANANAAANK